MNRIAIRLLLIVAIATSATAGTHYAAREADPGVSARSDMRILLIDDAVASHGNVTVAPLSINDFAADELCGHGFIPRADDPFESSC